MLNVITTTSTRTRANGETVQVTEWTVGGYTLRKAVEPDYTTWEVRNAARDLPSIYNTATFAEDTPVFGVNWSACGTQSTTDARAYAALLATAADVADAFNGIAAAAN